MSAPFFTVVVAAHNRGLRLEPTIDSVIAQRFGDWELVVVDDASTDSTPQLVESYDDPRIRLVRNQINLERCASRNRGVDVSGGRYVCFLDHDDRYAPDHLSALYGVIEAEGFPEAMFFTSALCRFEGQEELHERVLPPLGGAHPAAYFFDLVCGNATGRADSTGPNTPVTTSQSCFHREVIARERWNEEILMIEDTELFMRVAARHPVVQVHAATAIYTYRSDQDWESEFTARLMAGRLDGIRQMEANPRLRPFMDRRCLRRLKAHHHYALAVGLLARSSRTEALGSACLSLLYAPSVRPLPKIVLAVDSLPGGRQVRRAVAAAAARVRPSRAPRVSGR